MSAIAHTSLTRDGGAVQAVFAALSGRTPQDPSRVYASGRRNAMRAGGRSENALEPFEETWNGCKTADSPFGNMCSGEFYSLLHIIRGFAKKFNRISKILIKFRYIYNFWFNFSYKKPADESSTGSGCPKPIREREGGEALLRFNRPRRQVLTIWKTGKIAGC